MALIIEMPKLSDTMEEGAVANWLKKEGDFVNEGDPLVEIETDKATMEYQSPEEGVLVKILVPAGKGCPLNAPIAVFGKKGEQVDVAKLLGSRGDGGGKDAAKKADPAQAAAPAAKAAAAAPAPAAKPTVVEKAPTPVLKAAPAPEAQANAGHRRSSPLARKVAQEKGVDITALSGSGPSGRVVLRDVEGAKAGVSTRRSSSGPAVVTADRVIPVTMMRKTIAKRLLAGKNEAPHFYLTVSANMQSMLDWRTRLNAETKNDPNAVKVSVNDLLIFTSARALRRHPGVNASWEVEQIREFGGVHVAVAVALPTGLVTPVIRNADQLNIHEIAEQSRALIAKAKAGQLQNEDYSGGTFTISNLGMFGIEDFTAIINPPQAAILAVGATMATPWADERGQVVVQQRMKMTMSCDHRVVDGAMGAQYLQTLVSFLEVPALML